MSSIYLDNAATTQPLGAAVDAVQRYAETSWHNPSALYGPGVAVRRSVEAARETLLDAYSSDEHDCVFTSGGTESANMVVLNGWRRRKGANVVCAGFEHPCVEESFKALEEVGTEVRWVPVNPDGSVELEQLMNAVDASTAFVSVMHVSNETGAVNDIVSIARSVKQKAPHALFHSDGVQAFLRVPLQQPEIVDYYTVSAHKVHGLKGTGAVFFGSRTPLRALIRGGGQESGRRSGTENVPGILAFAEAVRFFGPQRKDMMTGLSEVRKVFVDELSEDDGFVQISPATGAAPHILTFSVRGVRGETLMHSLEQDGIYISVGAACSSKKGRSRAAKALGIPDETAQGMIRLSFSPFTTVDDAAEAAQLIRKHAGMLRGFSAGRQA